MSLRVIFFSLTLLMNKIDLVLMEYIQQNIILDVLKLFFYIYPYIRNAFINFSVNNKI